MTFHQKISAYTLDLLTDKDLPDIEEKMDGLDFHTAEGLTKEKYIIKTEKEMRRYLEQWLTTYGGT